MPRNKFLVGSIFSGLFVPRNLPSKGLRKVFTVEIYSQYDKKISICLNRGRMESLGNDDVSIVRVRN